MADNVLSHSTVNFFLQEGSRRRNPQLNLTSWKKKFNSWMEHIICHQLLFHYHYSSQKKNASSLVGFASYRREAELLENLNYCTTCVHITLSFLECGQSTFQYLLWTSSSKIAEGDATSHGHDSDRVTKPSNLRMFCFIRHMQCFYSKVEMDPTNS